jgi:hypothetical protein
MREGEEKGKRGERRREEKGEEGKSKLVINKMLRVSVL